MADLPGSWIEIEVLEAAINIPISNIKIPQKDYLPEGKFPIFDQGQSYIGGYTSSNGNLVNCDLPVILFGDHTRVVKYINRRFAPGADGIKILQPRAFIHARLFEYFVAYIAKKIPNKGYARHFQLLAKEKIPLPPAREQNRILEKIEELFSELDNGVESLNLAQEHLRIYRQSLLKYAFEGKLTDEWRKKNIATLESAEMMVSRIQLERKKIHQQQIISWEAGGKKGGKPRAPKPLDPLTAEELENLPKLAHGWIWVRLGSFISSIEAGKSFRCDEREPGTHEIGVAKVSAISWGEYDESESKTCTEKNKVNDAYLIKKDDFILSRSNTIELVGACVIAKNVSKKIMLSDKTLRINFIELRPEYILEFLRSRIGRKQIMDLSTGNQDSMRNIGQERIRSIAIPVCSNDEVLEVIQLSKASIDQIERLEDVIQSSLRHAEVLRHSILQKAFTGKLVPQDPNDEPASELLSRIKIEVAKSKPTKKKKAA